MSLELGTKTNGRSAGHVTFVYCCFLLKRVINNYYGNLAEHYIYQMRQEAKLSLG